MVARADLPSPRLDIINPAGACAGGEIELVIVGPDLEGGETLLFDHPGLRAEFLKEKTFKVFVANDAPTGTYDVRVSGRFGVSNPRLFAVCRGSLETAEVEPNNTFAQAQPVPVNSAISNHRDGNFLDFFKVPLQTGQRITADLQCARLDTEFDPVMILYAADGRQLATSSDHLGRDPLIDFTAPSDGDYVIEIRDLRYANGAVYRLLIHDRPQIENVFPRAVEAGRTAELSVFGRNLPNGQPSTWKIGDAAPLVEVKAPFETSADVFNVGGYRFREHPNHYSVLPTAATCSLIGDQFGPFDANAQTIVISAGPTSVEAEPNNSKDQPQRLALPAVLSGRFDQPRDADWYEFETDEMGGNYGFDVYSERIGGRADPYLAIYDQNGNRLSELDDFGHRRNAFDGHLRDPFGQVNLPGKQKIRLLIQDRYQRGGARYQYVLSVRKAQPDFFIAAIHGQANMQGTTVWQGGTNFLDLVVHHVDGSNGSPVTVTAEGLPPGLHAIPTIVANDSAPIIFWADEDAAPWTGPIKLWAEQKRGDTTLRREVRPYIRPHQISGCRPTRDFVLAIREKAPYQLAIEPDKITVAAGKPAELTLKLKRYWPDFTGPVNFIPLSIPGGFQLGNGTVQGEETKITINVQDSVRPGDYTLAVMGQAQVPYNKDAAVKDRPNTLVQLPSRPVTITVTEPKK